MSKSKISGCLNEIIWSNRYLRNVTKVRIYKSVIRPILTYAAETRNRYRKNYTNIGSNRNENVEKNYKQNKGRQHEKRKNTGNMWDPKNNILGTEEKNRMEYAHSANGGRSLSKGGTWRNPCRGEKPRSANKKMERSTGVNCSPAYEERRRRRRRRCQNHIYLQLIIQNYKCMRIEVNDNSVWFNTLLSNVMDYMEWVMLDVSVGIQLHFVCKMHDRMH